MAFRASAHFVAAGDASRLDGKPLPPGSLFFPIPARVAGALLAMPHGELRDHGSVRRSLEREANSQAGAGRLVPSVMKRQGGRPTKFK
jgi:hypothetical protein